MTTKPVEYLSDEAADRELLALSGYSKPGWYFWDETWLFCHGPFRSEHEAEQRRVEYTGAFDAMVEEAESVLAAMSDSERFRWN